MLNKAFITGVSGQDGFYLTEFLHELGYQVFGLVRRTAQERDLPPGIEVIEGDITDPGIRDIIEKIRPHEVYNLAAMSFVKESFITPKTTFDINALGTLNILEACRPIECKFYQASTSEMFGNYPPPQGESSPFHPRSPYGVSKLAAHWLTINYREAYGLKASTGILFNHESPRRGREFVTRKVCEGVAKIYFGLSQYIVLGNLDARRDWGHAKDFVKAMHLIINNPGDYVVSTGTSYSVKDLLTEAFSHINITDWAPYVKQNLNHYRPSDVDSLIGDSSKIRKLGWEPEYNFKSLIKEMVDAEITRLRNMGH